MSTSICEGLKPCPFCGRESPFIYIAFDTAVLECECGAKLKDGAVRVMYKKEELPEALRPYTYEPTLLTIQKQDGTKTGWPDHGYIGVNAMAAFEHAGVTSRWNRRSF